jgi:hypothetical protein
MQELFDTVATHLLKQNKQARERYSEGVQSVCQYRTSDGLKCAVGCLITQAVYDATGEFIEGETLEADEVQNAVHDSLGRDLTLEEFRLLQDLQSMHDCCEDSSLWPYKLEGIARKHGLQWSPR